jgi:hypothetical protein
LNHLLFPPPPPLPYLLRQDLLELQKKYTYSNVQLRVHFKRGLHPFYPPAIQIIRPHFANPIAGAVSSHPMLKLQNWQPMRSLRELFGEIKQFLGVGGRVQGGKGGGERRWAGRQPPRSRSI